MNNNKTKVCREKLATYKCIEPMDLTIKAINNLTRLKLTDRLTMLTLMSLLLILIILQNSSLIIAMVLRPYVNG